MAVSQNEQYKELCNKIKEWNKYRLQMFELSPPNENLEFFGVMRFYLFDQNEEVQTKCLRISSSATTQDVIEALLVKFWADLKNLDGPQTDADGYSLYEVLQTAGERRLKPDEFPLKVQLNWTDDCKEGRFLLKSNYSLNIGGSARSDPRKGKAKEITFERTKSSLADKLFSEKPETSFTKSIGDIEGAMQQKRKDKLEQKMRNFTNLDGGPDSGGPLKIYGFRLKAEFNYKSILAGSTDTAAQIVQEALKKFDIATADSQFYCLIQIIVPPGKEESDCSQKGPGKWSERFMDDMEVPWKNFNSFPKQKGRLMFCLVQRPPDRFKNSHPGSSSSMPSHNQQMSNGTRGSQSRNSAAGAPITSSVPPPPIKQLPYLIAIPTANSRSEVSKFDLAANTVEVGADPKTRYIGGQFIQLYGNGIRPHHCLLSRSEPDTWTISPSDSSSEVYVNGHNVTETVILPPGAVIQLGANSQFQFVIPELINKNRTGGQAMRGSNQMMLHSPPNGAPLSDVSNRVSSGEQGWGSPGAGSANSIPPMASPVSPDQLPPIEVGPDNTFNFASCVDTSETNAINDDDLPGAIEFADEMQEEILNYAVSRFDEVMTMFKVAPSFLFYMCARFRVSAKYNPSILFRVKKAQSFLSAVCRSVANVLQSRGAVACSVAVWMANCTELYHFIHQDTVLYKYTMQAQQLLHQLTRLCMKTFVKLVILELDCCIEAFFDVSDRDKNIPPELDLEIDPSRSTHYLNRWITSDIVGTRNETPEMAHVIEILASSWVLLRKCRVNAALNLQIFTSIFRYVTNFIFNTVLNTQLLCTEAWGERLSRRLSRVEAWAGREGLEFAAETEFARLKQTIYVLRYRNKFSRQEAESLVDRCSLLNSVQLHRLLENCSRSSGSATYHMSPEFMRLCIDFAREKVDAKLQRSNKPVLLDEDLASRALFRMPDDGFATDNVLGLSQAFEKFLNPLMDNKIAYISVLPDPSQRWDVYLFPDHIDPLRPQNSFTSRQQTTEASATSGADSREAAKLNRNNSSNEMSAKKVCVELRKLNNSLGLSIVSNQLGDERAILIKSVMPGGAADRDGRLKAGDRIVQVDQHSLRNLSREEAARILTQTGQTVRLFVVMDASTNQNVNIPDQNTLTRRRFEENPVRPKTTYDLQGEPANHGIRRRNSFDASSGDTIEQSHVYSRVNGVQKQKDVAKDLSSSKQVVDYAAVTLPRGNKYIQKRNMTEQPPLQSEMPGRAVNGGGGIMGNSTAYNPNYERRQKSQNFDVDSDPKERSRQVFPQTAMSPDGSQKEQYLGYPLLYTRRQESDMSSVAASYEPQKVAQKFARPYQIQPEKASTDGHRYMSSSVSNSNMKGGVNVFPAPPPSWQEQQSNSRSATDLTMAANKSKPVGTQEVSVDSVPQILSSVSPMSDSSTSSHHHNSSDSCRSELMAAINAPPVLTTQQLRRNEDQIRYQRTMDAIEDLESRLPNLTREERKHLDRLRLDAEFDRRVLEENTDRELNRKESDTTAYARAYSKKAAEHVQNDINNTNSMLQEAQMNFEAKARSNEQQRQLISKAKLRDLKAEIEENEQKTNEIQTMSPPPPASKENPQNKGSVSLSKPESVSGLANKTAKENQFQYLEEQKQRYLQRRQEMESYQMEKEREREAEKLKRIEEIRWQRELERLQMRNMQKRAFALSDEDNVNNSNSASSNTNIELETPSRPPLPSLAQQYDSPDPNYVDTRSSSRSQLPDSCSQVKVKADVSFESLNTSVDDSNNESNSSKPRPPLPPKPKPSAAADKREVDDDYSVKNFSVRVSTTSRPTQSKQQSQNTSFDSSLSPEERMRLYRQQLQFN